MMRSRGIDRPVGSVFYDHNAGLTTAAFWTAIADAEYTEKESFHWPTSATVFEMPDGDVELLARTARHGNVDAVLDFGDGLLHVHLEGGNVAGASAARTSGRARELVALAEGWWPRSVAAEDEIPMTFWSYSQHGPRSISRRIHVPSWEAVAGNYAGQTGISLERMMNDFRPSHGGQLILWQGIPGTGKTWALRALASEWRNWADFHYITDPEVFFGEKADYMLDVLLDDEDITHAVLGGSDEEDDELAEGGRWRVLLLEDTGEILAADAKEKTGQALSRLLNVVDGLIGQGLRILVLVTTNEELKKLHPAVSRPGRCAARIEFNQLPAGAANYWLGEHGIENIERLPGNARTLAELYAILDDREAEAEIPVGFVQQ